MTKEWKNELIKLTNALAIKFNELHPDEIRDSLRFKIQDVLLHMNDINNKHYSKYHIGTGGGEPEGDEPTYF